jgi:hypothetical protein
MARPVAIVCCGVLLAIFAVASMKSWWNRCCTFDEPLHLVSAFSESYLNDYRINPEDPPLWKHFGIAGISRDRLTLDTSSTNWQRSLANSSARDTFVTDTMFHTSANDADAVLREARLHMIFLGVALGAVIAWWSWRLAGPLAACVSCAAFCLDPNFLAHSSLLKNDVPMTLIFTGLMAAIWLLGERASAPRCVAVALLTGIGIVTKFSGLLAFPILALALLARVVWTTPWPVLRWTARTMPQRLLTAAGIGLFCFLVSWVVIWGAYSFRFSPGPSPDTITDLSDVMNACAGCESIAAHRDAPWDLTVEEVQQWAADWRPGPLEKSCLWLNNHHLLPQAFIRGFLFTYATTLYRGAFFCGELSYHGWWYYFPATMLFKTPLATLIALPLAVAAWLAVNKGIFSGWMQFFSSPRFWPFAAAAVAPTFYMASALHAHLNLGMRHIFPVYPFLFIFLGVAAAGAFRKWPKAAGFVTVIFVIGLAAETFAASPDFLSFFNVAAGGEVGGAKLLGDSNIDWGQDLKAVVAWRNDHPDGQLALSYFGSADPRYYHLHYVNVPGSLAPEDEPYNQNVGHYYAVSVTLLQGAYMSTAQHQPYLQLQRLKPIANLGGSIYVYETR